MTTVKFIFTFIVLSVSTVETMGAQEPISSCKKFIQLLRAPGIKITAAAQRQVLLPNEILAPIVTVKNNSNGILEIPYIDHSVGLLVIQGHVDFSSEFSNSEGKEPCSFPTVDLQPGEERSFPLNYPAQAWLEDDSESAYQLKIIPVGSKMGRNQFNVYIGKIKLLASYEIQPIQDVRSFCIDKSLRVSKFQRAMAEDPSRKDEGTCLLISVLRQGQYWYVMGGYDVTDISKVQREIALMQRTNRKLPPSEHFPEPTPRGGIVLATFDSEPVIFGSRLPLITKQEDFAVVERNTKHTLKSLGADYQRKNPNPRRMK
jgi:hypothetical protein